MLKRIALGLLKGSAIGAALGALLHFAFHLTPLTGVLAYLAYMGVGAAAGVVCGKPPWAEKMAWIETVLRTAVGIAIGAGLYWLAQRFLSIPLDLGPAGSGAISSLPMIVAPVVGAVYGTLLELDNDGKTPAGPESKKRVRVEAAAEPDEVEVESTSKDAKKRRSE